MVAKIAPKEMNAPASTLSTSKAEGPSPPYGPLLPPRARPWPRAGLSSNDHRSGEGGVGDRAGRPATDIGSSMRQPPPAASEEPNDLDRDDFHDRHGGEDHRVADVRPFGRGHARAIDEDRGVAGRAGGDADEIVEGDLQDVVADQQHDQHGRQQHEPRR